MVIVPGILHEVFDKISKALRVSVVQIKQVLLSKTVGVDQSISILATNKLVSAGQSWSTDWLSFDGYTQASYLFIADNEYTVTIDGTPDNSTVYSDLQFLSSPNGTIINSLTVATGSGPTLVFLPQGFITFPKIRATVTAGESTDTTFTTIVGVRIP